MFKERFKKERSRIGLTQEQIAKKIDTSRQNITNWETGYSVPSLELLERCSEVFDCSIDYLIGKTEYRTPLDEFEKKMNLTKIKNEIKIANKLDKITYDELDLNSYYDSEQDKTFDKKGNERNPEEIFFNKLRDLNILNDDFELSEHELDIIINFIKNNKETLKILINNSEKK